MLREELRRLSVSDPVTSIIADFHQVRDRLADLGDPASVRVAEAITRWLVGEKLDDAANLMPRWRRALQEAARDAALQALVALFPTLDDRALARRIVVGVARAAAARGVRPDGEGGYLYDLARAGVPLSESRWRHLVADARGYRDQHLATAALSVWSASKLEK